MYYYYNVEQKGNFRNAQNKINERVRIRGNHGTDTYLTRLTNRKYVLSILLCNNKY